MTDYWTGEIPVTYQVSMPLLDSSGAIAYQQFGHNCDFELELSGYHSTPIAGGGTPWNWYRLLVYLNHLWWLEQGGPPIQPIGPLLVSGYGEGLINAGYV